MEKHPSTRPVLADDTEGIRKLGYEARKLWDEQNRVIIITSIMEYIDSLPEETSAEMLSKINLLRDLSTASNEELQRLAREYHL